MSEIDRIVSSRGFAWTVAVALIVSGLWLGRLETQVDTLRAQRIDARNERNTQIAALDQRLRFLEVQAGSINTDIAAIRALLTTMDNRLERIDTKP